MIALGIPTHFEAKDLLATVKQPTRKVIDGIECTSGTIANVEVVIAITGIGRQHSSRAARVILNNYSISFFILCGFAGALVPSLHMGQILIAKNYSSEDLINYIRLVPGFDLASLHTADEVIATAGDKARLAATTHCQMVDMEMSAVADVINAAGIEILGVRAISDLASQDVPLDLFERAYDYAKAKPTPVRLAFYLMLKPWKIAALRELFHPLPEVRRKLSDFLITLLPELP